MGKLNDRIRIMLGEYSELLYFLPILIRVAVGIIILAMLYDYLRRKWARMIVDTVKAAGAESPETALSTSELEASCRGFARAASFLLKKHSPLRRYVKSNTDTEEFKAETNGAGEDGGTTDIDKKKARKAIDKSFSYSARRLTGEEKWYVEPYRAPGGVDDGNDEGTRAARLPYLLRDGAEPRVMGVIVGCVLLVIFGELIIRFLPQIMNFFTKLAEITQK